MKNAFLTDHPTGGFTLAIPISDHSTARMYRGWFPPSIKGREAGDQAALQWNAKLNRERRDYQNPQNSPHSQTAALPAA